MSFITMVCRNSAHEMGARAQGLAGGRRPAGCATAGHPCGIPVLGEHAVAFSDPGASRPARVLVAVTSVSRVGPMQITKTM